MFPARTRGASAAENLSRAFDDFLSFRRSKLSARQTCRFTPRLPPQVWEGCGRGATSAELPTPNSQLPKDLRLDVGSWRLGVVRLLAVQLHDQLFLHRQVDLLARRQRSDAAGHLPGVEGEPLGNT